MSSDFIVSSSINITQYMYLQMSIAKHFGWQVGTLSWKAMNVHLYHRHIEQARELIKRHESVVWEKNSAHDFSHNVYKGENSEHYQSQDINVYLNVPDKTNFYDIYWDSFVVENYNPMTPQLKFDLAI